MKEHISPSQAGKLCAMTIFANKIFLLPSLMYEGAKSDGFFIALLLYALDFLTLIVFLLLKRKYPTQKLTEILEKRLGKVVTKIIYIVFMVFFLFKILLTYSVFYVYMKQQIYQDEFTFLTLVCVLPVINHGVLLGLRSFARTVEMYYFVVLAGFAACLLVGLGTMETFPHFFSSNPSAFFSTAFRYVFSFGDYLFLFFIMDKVEIDGKKDEWRIIKPAIIAVVFVLALFFIFYACYQVTAFMHNNAIVDIIAIFEYSALGRIDVIAMVLVMFLCLFALEVFHYSFCEAFCGVFKGLNRTYSVVVFDVIFLALYITKIGRYSTMISYVQSWLPYFCILTEVLFPFVMLLLSMRKKKGRKYEKVF